MITYAILIYRKSGLKWTAGISSFCAKGQIGGCASHMVCFAPTQICCRSVRQAGDQRSKNKPSYVPIKTYKKWAGFDAGPIVGWHLLCNHSVKERFIPTQEKAEQVLQAKTASSGFSVLCILVDLE